VWPARLADGAGQQQMAGLIEQMSHDDRVDLLRRLRPSVAEGLLRLVDEADRRDIAALARHAEGTAGSLMTTDYAWVPHSVSVEEAFHRLRLQAPDSETIYYVYVLDEERRLVGVVTLRKLVVAPREATARSLVNPDLVTVQIQDDQEHVANVIAQYDLLSVPVVDSDRHLVGIVTHDDAIDVLVQEATEDAQHLGGVLSMAEDYLKAGFASVWRRRVVWLACLFVAELLTFTAMASFEHAIERVVVLSLFVPLCISTGGNSGSQAATLITRAMALGHVRVGQWLAVLRHELLMGLALGLTLGVIGFVRASLTPHEVLRGHVEWWQLAVVIAQAVTAICLWGTLVSSMLPLVFKRLGFDPAFASSPFVATLVDVTPYSRSARAPSPRNRGRATLSPGGVCLDSVLQWWHRLLRVFPVCDSEPGSVFGPITGDPISVTRSRERVVPVCNRDLLPADSPAHCLGMRPPIPSPLLCCGVLPWPHRRPDANQPPPLLPAASQPRLRPNARPTTVARPGPRPRARPFGRGRPPRSKRCPCNTRTPPASTSAPAPTGSASASPAKPLPA
jgi:magnesium transporter